MRRPRPTAADLVTRASERHASAVARYRLLSVRAARLNTAQAREDALDAELYMCETFEGLRA